jgi:hypothetical protein
MNGALISAPEQGEGGNTNVYYEPSVEAVQEFKVQNNSFSAEFGSNGDTVATVGSSGRPGICLFFQKQQKAHFCA